MFNNFIDFVRDIYKTKGAIPLHQPYLDEDEKASLVKVVESSFVSSVGLVVDEFEKMISDYTSSKHAVATVNGTAALHVSLLLSGVIENDEVIVQSLTFVATCNAIHYCKAKPIFVDVDRKTLGLSAKSLKYFLEENCEIRENNICWNKLSNNPVRACIITHTFGLSSEVFAIKNICDRYNIVLIEDAAESLGTFYKGKHSGTTGKFGVLSFNGNKIITTGGGGMILTNEQDLAIKAKHLTTTAKLKHKWLFQHDRVAFNYRMPNLNAALGISQMNKLSKLVNKKRKIASLYHNWGNKNNFHFMREIEDSKSNYWLNTLITNNIDERDLFLHETNSSLINTRPAWTPMHKLEFNKNFQTHNLVNTEWLFQRIVNVPSSVTKHV